VFSFEEKNILRPVTTKGRGKAKLEGKGSGTPPNPEAIEAKGPNNLTHFTDW
jgi:hypothetical protein